MSERPSSREILDRIRAANPSAGQAKQETGTVLNSAAPVVDSQASGALSIQEKLAAIRAQTSSNAPLAKTSAPVQPRELPQAAGSTTVSEAPVAPIDSNSSVQRPLSVQEKLAAARTAVSAQPHESPRGKDAPGQPSPPAPKGQGLSVAEKLAAARAGSTEPAAQASQVKSPGSGPSGVGVGVDQPVAKPGKREESRSREVASQLKTKAEELKQSPLPRATLAPGLANPKTEARRPESLGMKLGQAFLLLFIGAVTLGVLATGLWYLQSK